MDFDKFIKAYAKGAGLLFASAAVSYFLTFHSTLSPPLKPRQAIYAMSLLVESYAILVGLNALASRKPPLNLMIGCVLLYLVSLFSLTYLIPTSDSSYREAIGFVCKKEFTALYGEACYWIPPETLANASFEAHRIWEYWSVQLVRLYLGAIWLLLVWSVVMSIALSIRQKQRVSRPNAARKKEKAG
jgi:hypothetical protein